MLRNTAGGVVHCLHMKKYVRKATRVGKRSIAVVIPAELVDDLKIREKQKLTVYKSGDKIVVRDWKEGDEK